MNTPSNTFTKAERLCRTKIIDYLFEHGNTFHQGLFKVVWSVSPVVIPSPAQVAFSVSKRSFKKAVSRNLAKRRMREAYRLNKTRLNEHLIATGNHLVFVVILKGNVMPEYARIEKSVNSIIDMLISLNPARV